MRNARMIVYLVVMVLFLVAGQGFGLTQFNNGVTYKVYYTLNDDVYVDFGTPNGRTTVDIFTRGNIPSPYILQGFYNSKINIFSGGTVGGNLNAYTGCTVTIDEGTVGGRLTANNGSHINMFSGTVGSDLAAGDSQLTLSGGTVGGYLMVGGSQLTMSGGTVHNHLWAESNSQVTMSGGSVGSDFWSESSQITMSGGTVGGFFHAWGNSQVTMSGGAVSGTLYAGHSQIDWSGGTIGSEIQLDSQSILAITGSNFAINGTPISSGDITSILGSSYSNDPYRILTGTLANGDRINNQFLIGDTAKIVLIPEPTTIMLLGVGGMLLRKQKQRMGVNKVA